MTDVKAIVRSNGPLRLEGSERDVAGCRSHLNTITSR